MQRLKTQNEEVGINICQRADESIFWPNQHCSVLGGAVNECDRELRAGKQKDSAFRTPIKNEQRKCKWQQRGDRRG